MNIEKSKFANYLDKHREQEKKNDILSVSFDLFRIHRMEAVKVTDTTKESKCFKS